MSNDKIQRENAEKWERCKALFFKTISNRYKMHCIRERIEPTDIGLLEYVNTCQLIEDATLVRFTVTEQYPEYYYRKHSKRAALLQMEIDFPISSRHIRNVLARGGRNEKRHFRYDPDREMRKGGRPPSE